MAEQEIETEVDDDVEGTEETGGKGEEKGKGGQEEEFTPPTKEEWARTQAALKKANEQAKTHRLKVQELAKANEDADGKAAREAAEQAQAKYKPVAVRAAAKAEFLAAGLNDPKGERVAKLSRLLDLDQVEIDDEGDITGLTDQVATIKADYPELFTTPKQKPPRLDASGRKITDGGKPQTTGDRIAAQVMGAGQTGRD